jgi:DNA-binding NarL/FixJ family response regulator
MKLLIADDHPMIHKGIIFFLKEEYLNIEITSVFNGNELIKELKRVDYNILILDINFPGNENISSVEFIIKNFPKTKVIMFSQNPEDIYALRYQKIGAHGYVQKSAPMDVLLNAIVKVNNGKKYFSEDVLEALLSSKNNTMFSSNPFELLSNRELEVANQLVKGADYKTIGEVLHISPSTISTYKARIFEKLQITNDADFFELANQFLKDYQ